jgi:hypothetical protein
MNQCASLGIIRVLYNTATGEQYLRCIGYLELIKNELSEFGIIDLINRYL